MATQTSANRLPAVGATIKLHLHGRTHRLTLNKAFAVGCWLLQRGQAERAAKVFERLAAMPGCGKPVFIMWACSEAAAKHFDRSIAALARVFGEGQQDVAEALHNAFVSYFVGLRQEALATLVELANHHRELPALCLLLGELLAASGKPDLARQCWQKALQRDQIGGTVAAVAKQRLERPAS